MLIVSAPLSFWYGSIKFSKQFFVIIRSWNFNCFSLMVSISARLVSIFFQIWLFFTCSIPGILTIRLYKHFCRLNSRIHLWGDCPAFSAIHENSYHVVFQFFFIYFTKKCSFFLIFGFWEASFVILIRLRMSVSHIPSSDISRYFHYFICWI